ncbi:hypothetical protein EDD80_10841 [Anseongella ginsenosidimutans]|uniref:Uncharacterized protein n=1 Tax=Anseongella ginsenosidimutans TaxID=496056 RepID=A0A4R3KNU9_9SPHI|nr:hypothetical protein [Anseongella ginsenosidimutans]QEC53868.1 hypothetical protein FRZ59_17065 [Anseongella ginsenosidimutans]TCS86250.1 hypothetical protein EDD80_10841 [Anseongella ginsenosidimutans]
MQTKEPEFPITGREGAPIDMKTATLWTRNYRRMRPDERISHFFGRVHLQDILDQEGCMGIRIYYANSLRLNAWQQFLLSISNFIRKGLANAEGEEHLILVGSNREGKDQLPETSAGSEPSQQNIVTSGIQTMSFRTSAGSGNDFKVIEQSNPCPGSPGCPKNSLTEG